MSITLKEILELTKSSENYNVILHNNFELIKRDDYIKLEYFGKEIGRNYFKDDIKIMPIHDGSFDTKALNKIRVLFNLSSEYIHIRNNDLYIASFIQVELACKELENRFTILSHCYRTINGKKILFNKIIRKDIL